jgi:hypothetical protein
MAEAWKLAPAVSVAFLQYGYGKPADKIEIGASAFADLSDEDLLSQLETSLAARRRRSDGSAQRNP